MDPLALVDPALRPLLAVWPTTTLSAATLNMARGRELPAFPIEPDDIIVEERSAPGPAGGDVVPLLIYRPLCDDVLRGCLFHIHGGGFVMGAAREVEFAYRPIASALGCVIVSVDYRLAPEAVFPAAIEDCYAGLAWTFANAAALNVDRRRIGVTGESAGGGLAAALALMARDRGEYRLAFQHLTYPMLDDRTCVATAPSHAGRFVWNADSNRFGWGALLGREPGGEGVSPYAAPARAEDLSGLPPTYIMTGALDLFVEEDIDYARRLIAAGVPTELHVFPGAFHGFDILPGAPVADAARAARLAALKRALHSDYRQHRPA